MMKYSKSADISMIDYQSLSAFGKSYPPLLRIGAFPSIHKGLRLFLLHPTVTLLKQFFVLPPLILISSLEGHNNLLLIVYYLKLI